MTLFARRRHAQRSRWRLFASRADHRFFRSTTCFNAWLTSSVASVAHHRVARADADHLRHRVLMFATSSTEVRRATNLRRASRSCRVALAPLALTGPLRRRPQPRHPSAHFFEQSNPRRFSRSSLLRRRPRAPLSHTTTNGPRSSPNCAANRPPLRRSTSTRCTSTTVDQDSRSRLRQATFSRSAACNRAPCATSKPPRDASSGRAQSSKFFSRHARVRASL